MDTHCGLPPEETVTEAEELDDAAVELTMAEPCPLLDMAPPLPDAPDDAPDWPVAVDVTIGSVSLPQPTIDTAPQVAPIARAARRWDRPKNRLQVSPQALSKTSPVANVKQDKEWLAENRFVFMVSLSIVWDVNARVVGPLPINITSPNDRLEDRSRQGVHRCLYSLHAVEENILFRTLTQSL